MDELTAISDELALVRRQFEKRHALLELRLAKEQHKAQDKGQKSVKPAAKPTADKSKTAQPKVVKPLNRQPVFCGPVKPGFLALQLMKLSGLLFSLFAVFVSWAAPFTALYQHFKSRNMLAVMWLMVCGVTFTVAGFGYLLQIVVVQSLPEMKVFSMALVSLAVLALGIRLKHKTRFTEFSSSIIALGLILGFSCIYFAGSVFQLISQIMVLLAYVLMAVLTHFIANRYQCSWLSSFGIIGVSLLPLLNPDTQFDSGWYLLALWLVSFSCIYMAFMRFGLWLAVVTLGCVVTAFELLLAQGQSFAYLVVVTGFYVLFFGFVVVLAKLKAEKVQSLLLFLFSVVVSFVALLLQLNGLFTLNLSVVLVANVMMALFASFYLRALLVGSGKLVAESMILVAAIWLVGAVMALFEQGYWGLVWALEGLSLLWLGKKLAAKSVLNKGQLLVVVGLAYNLVALAPYYPAPAFLTFDGFSLALACVLITAVWRWMWDEKPALVVLESLLACLLVIGLVEAWVGPYSALVVILLQIACLWRAKLFNSLALEYLALSMLLLPVQAIVVGAIQVSSVFFVDLPVFAQLAMLVLVAQLWGMALYYRRYYPQGQLRAIAELGRSLFYLILPICWLPEAIKTWGVDVVTVLWLSPLLAFHISKRLSQYAVQFYGYLIAVVTAISLVILIAYASMQAALIGIVGFGGFYLWCFYLESKYQHGLAKCCASIGYFAWGIAVSVFINEICATPVMSLLFAAIYWGIGLFDHKMLPLFTRNYRLIVVMNIFIYSCSWIGSLFERNYSLVPVVALLLAGLFKYCHRGTDHQLFKLSHVNSQLLVHGFIAINYCSFFIGGFSPDWSLMIAPTLVVHGVMMLFVLPKLKNCVKASLLMMGLGVAKLLLVDANITLMMHKVMLFMGLGIFVLVASFVYQRLIGKATEEPLVESVQ